MSLQETLLSNMFDPTNIMVTKMLDGQDKTSANQTTLAINAGDLATRALLEVDASGRIKVRGAEEARAMAQTIVDFNSMGKAQPQAQLTVNDVVQIFAQLQAQPKPKKIKHCRKGCKRNHRHK